MSRNRLIQGVIVSLLTFLIPTQRGLLAQRSTTIKVQLAISSVILVSAYTKEELRSIEKGVSSRLMKWLQDNLTPWTYSTERGAPTNYLLEVVAGNGAPDEVLLDVSVSAGGQRLISWAVPLWGPGNLCCPSSSDAIETAWAKVKRQVLQERAIDFKNSFFRIPITERARWTTEEPHRIVVPLPWENYSFLRASSFTVSCGDKDLLSWPRLDPDEFPGGKGERFKALSLVPVRQIDRFRKHEEDVTPEALHRLFHIQPRNVFLKELIPATGEWDKAPETGK